MTTKSSGMYNTKNEKQILIDLLLIFRISVDIVLTFLATLIPFLKTVKASITAVILTISFSVGRWSSPNL